MTAGRIADVEPQIAEMRMIKGPAEIEFARHAGKVAEAMMAAQDVHAAYADVIQGAEHDYPFRCSRTTGYSFLIQTARLGRSACTAEYRL